MDEEFKNELNRITTLVDIHSAHVESDISLQMIRELKKLGYLVMKERDKFVISKKIKHISMSKNSGNSMSGRLILNKHNLEHLGSKNYVVLEAYENRLIIIPLKNKPIL